MKKQITTLILLCFGFAAFADDLTFVVINTTTGFSTGAIDMNVSGGVGPYTYSWSGPGGFTSNSEDLSGLATGTYTVTVTDQYCGVATTTVFVDASTDVTEKDSGIVFSIFPNPTNNQIVVSCNGSFENAYVKVFSINGKLICETAHAPCGAFVIDLTEQARGVYFVELNNNGKLSRKRVVKQ